MNFHYTKEKCGVVGVWTAEKDAPYLARRGLIALQHRGQEGAGLSVLDPQNNIITHKGMGLIPNVLSEETMKLVGGGNFSIAQNRYGTSGSGNVKNAQPIERRHEDLQMTLGHNGNIPEDLQILRKKVNDHSKQISDTSLMASIIMKERIESSSWEEALIKALPQFKGAFCNIILTNEPSIFAMRDPFGIRPLSLGKFEDGWIIASESVALDATGAEFVRDIEPGEIIKIDKKGKLTSFFFGEPKRPQHCIFEYIYFARPDSFLNGRRVRTGREASGRLLAKRIKAKGLKPDAVVPTFDSGYAAAKGCAEELGIPIIDAITTSHYVGRTFIQPGQHNRIAAVSGKHNIVPDEIYGKKIVIVDDSAVRLTTSTRLARGFKEAGVKETYMGFASPPVVDQCDMGIDMRTKKELPAAKFAKLSFEKIENKVAEHVGANAVVYLPIEETAQAFGGTNEDFYYYPFGGPHPIRGKQHIFPKLKKKIGAKPKIAVFISGRGTFVQDVIDEIENGTLEAEIVNIICNNPDAPGLERAKKYNIPTTVLPYTNKFKDKELRKAYDEKLIKVVKDLQPDLILLSGWQMILSERILKEAQDTEIPVINHHPGLLTNDDADTVATSRGTIPVLRGGSVWKDAFEQKLPVSGITVHQVLPGDNFDVGPVIMKSEVKIHADDTFESWKKRMDQAEHALLPAAVKRVLHIMKSGIDINHGGFIW
jgi:amidophosphoribosyltransferase